MTHHFVMTSSLRIKNFKIDKFGDFSSEIDFNTKMEILRDVISLIINQCDPRRPKGASGGHKVSASRAAQASEARLFIYLYICHGETSNLGEFEVPPGGIQIGVPTRGI